MDRNEIEAALEQAIERVKARYADLKIWSRPASFFSDEITNAIKGQAVRNLEGYLALDRTGRRVGLQTAERRAVFAVYDAYQRALHPKGLSDFADYVVDALQLLELGLPPERYSAAVVDEIQDLSAAVLRLIRRLVPEGSNNLFLVGDGLQRIYPGGYVLSRIGINVTGRGSLLRRNYRNTQEILRTAYTMMTGRRSSDLDEEESDPVEPEYSVRHGEIPVLYRPLCPRRRSRGPGGRSRR